MFPCNHPINERARFLLNLGNGRFMPMMYSTPQDELLACRRGAWLGVFLNISPVYDISGPDAVKFLNYVCVNRDFAKMKVGSSRHAILCNEKGQMLADGVLMRKEENLYRTYWLAPVIAYYVDTLGMDVKGQWIRDEFFLQIDGPRSLEIMEQASQSDLHSLKFAQHTHITIAGIPTTIHRLGMSGCLAYEMHGPMKDVGTVYEAILAAGKDYDIRPLGFTQYCRNHTQGGYPNQWIHYYYAFLESGESMKKYVIDNAPAGNPQYKGYQFVMGSAADDIQNAFVTPFDVKWDYLINYDHDFIGKEALLAIKAAPPRTVVTLEWNAEDVGKAFAATLTGDKAIPLDDITSTGDGGYGMFVISKVMHDGKLVGIASGRAIDYYHKDMISLAFLDRELAKEGQELTVLWGTDPSARVEIRANVAQFPYYNEKYRNETFDTEEIPHPNFSK